MSKLPALDGPSLQPASGGAADAIVVLVHGFGSNGADMIGMAPQWRHALPGALFVAPNAPEPCHGSLGGYQWWALHDLSRPALAAGAARAAPVLDAYLDTLLEKHGLREDRLLLVGFSQGTMLSLHVAPRRARQVAGVIGYSGMLPHPASATDGILNRPPILLIHGDRDDVVPFLAFQEAQHALHRAGFPVKHHISAGLGHSVDQAGLQHGIQFARECLYGRISRG